jgi:hypothetical protein
LHVGIRIADHPGPRRINSKFLCQRQQHAGGRLTTLALIGELSDDTRRMMKAKSSAIKAAACARQLVQHPVVDFLNLGNRHYPLRCRWLVTHIQNYETDPPQRLEVLCCPVRQMDVFGTKGGLENAAALLDQLVDYTVPVQEDGAWLS